MNTKDKKKNKKRLGKCKNALAVVCASGLVTSTLSVVNVSAFQQKL